jgi:hypothetical protein
LTPAAGAGPRLGHRGRNSRCDDVPCLRVGAPIERFQRRCDGGRIGIEHRDAKRTAGTIHFLERSHRRRAQIRVGRGESLLHLAVVVDQHGYGAAVE